MPDFSIRTLYPEKMDQPGVSEYETRQALRELETINRMLGGYRVIFHALEQMDWSKRPTVIVDLGCGGGDLLRAIASWAEHKRKRVDLLGIDNNPVMTAFSREESRAFYNIHYKTMNVFDNELMNEKADIVMSSLFMHHFDNEELVRLIRRMYDLASQAVIINDIHRHWLAYYGIKVITSLFSKTYLVKYDGPLSVARSLNKKEWKAILAEAGITDYSLRWMWAWRWQLIIKKPKTA